MPTIPKNPTRGSRALGCLVALALGCSGPVAEPPVGPSPRATGPPAGSWTQWRGEQRDGQASSFAVPAAWPPALQAAWSVDVDPGHAAPVVAEGAAFLLVRSAAGEAVEARGLADGELSWRQEYETGYAVHPEADWHDRGPFSAPLYADGVLYTLGIAEVLSAWRAATGELLWRRDFGDEFDEPWAYYGTSTSPLLAAGHLILHVGGPGDGALVALDPATGEERWRWDGDGPPYGSAVEARFGDTPQIVSFTQKHFVGIAAEEGELLWQVPYEVPWDNTVQTPLLVGPAAVVAAWDTPARAYRPRLGAGGWEVETDWENAEASVAYTSSVLIDGAIWGFGQKGKGRLHRLDAATGETTWQGPGRQGDHATLVAAGRWLLVFYDSGRLEVLDTTSDPPAVAAEYTVAQSALWAHPAVFGDALLVKDQKRLTLWRLPG